MNLGLLYVVSHRAALILAFCGIQVYLFLPLVLGVVCLCLLVVMGLSWVLWL